MSGHDHARQDADALLLRFYSGDLTDAEALRLLEFIDGRPEFLDEIDEDYSVELHLRAPVEREKLRKSFPGHLTDHAAGPPFPGAASEKDVKVAAAPPDFAPPPPASIDWAMLNRMEREAVALSREPDFPTAAPAPEENSSPVRQFLRRLGIPGKIADRLPSIARMLAVALVFLAIGVGIGLTRELLFVPSFGAYRTVAHLAGFDHVVWGDCDAPILPGDPIEAGWLLVDAGAAALKLPNGTELVLEGPAEVRIDSDTSIFLKQGYLSAEVPPLAEKLKIKTPRMTVHVLGTAFWIKVDGEDAEVHLLRGKLELTHASFGKLLLDAGEALALSSQGKSRRLDVVKRDFTPSKKVVDRTQTTLRTWEAAKRGEESDIASFNADPSLLVHFDFERVGRSVPNISRTGKRVIRYGDVTGCSRVEGCTPYRRGILFGDWGGWIAFDVPGSLSSLTLCTRVRIDRIPRSRVPVCVSDGAPPGSIQWTIGPDGILTLGIAESPAMPETVLNTEPVFTAERVNTWVHLTCVLDGKTRRAALYLDGERIASRELNFEPTVEIGRALLGSWHAARSRNQYESRMSMDSFMLFNRALDEEEIRRVSAKP